MRRRGTRAAVGASLRLRRSRSAARQREASGRQDLARQAVAAIGGRPQTADNVSWRSRKTRPQTQLELELERDAEEDIVSVGPAKSRTPARGTHPGAAANRSRQSRASRTAAAARPSTAPNSYAVGAAHSLKPLSPLTSAASDSSGGHAAAPLASDEQQPPPQPSGWSTAPRIRQRRLRQELLQAVEEGDTTEVDVLLRFGTPVRGTHDDHLDSSLLHTAALFGYQRICELLIEHGAEVNAADAALETPLMWAAKWGHPEICRLLLENGALLHLKCAMGESARDKAEHGGHAAVIEAMQAYEDEGKAFVDKIFSEIDTDGSGEIDKEELGAYVLQQRADHTLVIGGIDQELQTVKRKLEEESEGHLQAQEQLTEVSAAYERSAESAQWWEERHAASMAELSELRAALTKAEQRAERLAQKNAKHDSIVSEVQASAQVALKAASHAVASALDRRARGSHAGAGIAAGTSSSSSELAISPGGNPAAQQQQRPSTADGSTGATMPAVKPALPQGRRWSVSAGGPTGAGGGSKRPASAKGEEWQAIAGFVEHAKRPLPLPAGLLQTIMEQLTQVLKWIEQGGAEELHNLSRSSSRSRSRSKQRVQSPSSPSSARRTKKQSKFSYNKGGGGGRRRPTSPKSPGPRNGSSSPQRSLASTNRSPSPSSPSKARALSPSSLKSAVADPVLPWIVERLTQAQAAGQSLRCLLEEADIPLPVRTQERQSRQLERLIRDKEKLSSELLETNATSQRWTARALAAEARAARAEATAAELEMRAETAKAELSLVKEQKRAAVGKEVKRQRDLEAQLSMQAERVRLANMRARAVAQERLAEESPGAGAGAGAGARAGSVYEYDPKARLHLHGKVATDVEAADGKTGRAAEGAALQQLTPHSSRQDELQQQTQRQQRQQQQQQQQQQQDDDDDDDDERGREDEGEGEGASPSVPSGAAAGVSMVTMATVAATKRSASFARRKRPGTAAPRNRRDAAAAAATADAERGQNASEEGEDQDAAKSQQGTAAGVSVWASAGRRLLELG